jgi:2-haloacid dehalogenase
MSSETRGKTIIAFDLYGTILSTSSVAKELSKQLNINDAKASEVASLWRRYQLEYSWRLSCMSKLNCSKQPAQLPAPVTTAKFSFTSFESSSIFQ